MYRLVLAGDGGTGKSSFLLRLCMEFRGDISSTLGTPPTSPGTLGAPAVAEAQEQRLTVPPGRGGLPDKAATGGWGTNHVTDLGHSGAGEVTAQGLGLLLTLCLARSCSSSSPAGWQSLHQQRGSRGLAPQQ